MLNADECLVLVTHSGPGPGSRFSSPWQLHWLAHKPGGDEGSPRETGGDGQSRLRRTEVMTQPPPGHMSFSYWPIACLTFHLRFTLSLSPQNHSIRMMRNQHSRVEAFPFPKVWCCQATSVTMYNKHRLDVRWCQMTTSLLRGEEWEQPIRTAVTSDTPPHTDWNQFCNDNNAYNHNYAMYSYKNMMLDQVQIYRWIDRICNVFILKYDKDL